MMYLLFRVFRSDALRARPITGGQTSGGECVLLAPLALKHSTGAAPQTRSICTGKTSGAWVNAPARALAAQVEGVSG